MKSIRKTLTRRLSVVISLLVIVVLLAADIGVDSWVEQEFNQAMKAKIGMLQSLVNEDVEGVEFEFAGEYLPEFEGTTSPEYFQLWYQGRVFEKSDTLGLYTAKQLPFKDVGLSEYIVEDIVLPDGRAGRIIYTKYLPQIDSVDRDEFYRSYKRAERSPMLMAYATSTELLKYTLWFIDGAFLIALIVVPLVVRFTVSSTVSFALAPLDELNFKIKALRFSTQEKHQSFHTDVDELVPITDSLNHFIDDNYSLYLREKRLTSDIAHELKTPVAELINMAEVAMKFPGEKQFEQDFKPRVLQISMRMKSIISGLMLIQQYSFKKLDMNDEIDFCELVKQALESKKILSLDILCPSEKLHIRSNQIALSSIISNLIDNAVEHRKPDSEINVRLGLDHKNYLYIDIANEVNKEVSESDLKQMFEPFWQKDFSRTSEGNYGLGLSIVKTLCDAIGANITVFKPSKEQISFLVTLNNKPNVN